MINPSQEFQFKIRKHTCIKSDQHAQCFETLWQVPKEISYFKGHFPDFSVLPAIAIIDATSELIGQAQGHTESTLSGVKTAKFTKPITPGLLLLIQLHQISEKEWLTEWRSGEPSETVHLFAQLSIFS